MNVSYIKDLVTHSKSAESVNCSNLSIGLCIINGNSHHNHVRIIKAKACCNNKINEINIKIVKLFGATCLLKIFFMCQE